MLQDDLVYKGRLWINMLLGLFFFGAIWNKRTFDRYKRISYNFDVIRQLHALLLTQSRLTAMLSSLIVLWLVGS